MENIIKQFKTELDKLSITLTEQQLEQFRIYKDLIQEWNKKFNLTGVSDDAGIYFRHFLDSLAVVQCVDIQIIKTVADVGTGAGLPGIPLKIVFPHIKMSLFDSTKKKCTFLEEVINKLQLSKIEIIAERAENMPKTIQYDLILTRAVGKMEKILPYCLPYVQIDGQFIAYKQDNVEEELKEADNILKKLGGSVKKVKKVDVFDGKEHVKRAFVIICREMECRFGSAQRPYSPE
ncbi:MAG: 16S rRNA (guanine(527)-N(7))-methyltransferase RsmG [Candidatus Margulisiibacteriota bacterium]